MRAQPECTTGVDTGNVSAPSEKNEKDKSISNARLVLSYVLIGAAGYYLGYVSSKEDMKDWGWKKQSKKDDWKRK